MSPRANQNPVLEHGGSKSQAVYRLALKIVAALADEQFLEFIPDTWQLDIMGAMVVTAETLVLNDFILLREAAFEQEQAAQVIHQSDPLDQVESPASQADQVEETPAPEHLDLTVADIEKTETGFVANCPDCHFAAKSQSFENVRRALEAHVKRVHLGKK